MTDPEEIMAGQSADPEDDDVEDADELDRPLPVEADPADVVEQRIAVPDDDEHRED